MARHAFAVIVVLVLTSNVFDSVSCFAVGSAHNVRNSIYSSQAKRLELEPLNSLKIDNADGTENENEGMQYLKNVNITVKSAKRFPRLDALDKHLTKIAIPLIISTAVTPIVGAVDLFWVNRMGNPLAVAGQAAANQVFNTAFYLTSFLSAVMTQQVAKVFAKNDKEGLQDTICQTFFVGGVIALLATPLLFFNPESVLSVVLKKGAPAMEFAKPYLMIRSLAFYFNLISLIASSAFRGTVDTITPVKISILANIINAILDPILIFNFSMGVPGAALATAIAEVISAFAYLTILFKKKMITFSKMFSLPSWEQLKPLVKGGAALQLRNVALNLTFLMVTRVTQSIDETGVAAAAHALSIQTFQVGGIVLFALSMIAQFVVPIEMEESKDKKTGRKVGGSNAARAVINRLMSWGLILGSLLGLFQLAILPTLHKATPMVEVREIARIPSLLASFYQAFNGLVFIGEGVMIGTGNFLQLSISTVISTTGCLFALKTLPPRFGLTGVWLSFGVFNILRLAGVVIHQLFTGKLASRNMVKPSNIEDKS